MFVRPAVLVHRPRCPGPIYRNELFRSDLPMDGRILRFLPRLETCVRVSCSRRATGETPTRSSDEVQTTTGTRRVSVQLFSGSDSACVGLLSRQANRWITGLPILNYDSSFCYVESSFVFQIFSVSTVNPLQSLRIVEEYYIQYSV